MKPVEKKLLNNYRKLNEADKQALEKFAAFLTANASEKTVPVAEVVLIEAKPNESVVAGLKRLSASYPMLDKSIMLNQTSSLMTQHIMQGREKTEVIAELELVFAEQYRVLKESVKN